MKCLTTVITKVNLELTNIKCTLKSCLRSWLEVSGFGSLSHGSTLSKAGFRGRRKLHGAHGLCETFLFFNELIFMLGELAVQSNGFSSKKSQLFCAAVPAGKLRKEN